MTDEAHLILNPFPGLRPFRSDEDYLFFGRESQTEELLGRLGRNRFVAVVGTSGSGKSSLVRCGVLSELQGGRLLDAGSDWEIALLQPSGDPVGKLARGLCDAGLYDAADPEARPNLIATLTRSRWELVEALSQSQIEEGCNLLVVVDQFEEIFRFREAGGKGEEQAPDFVQLLLEAVRQQDVPIYVMITMRSDFLGDCARFAGLAEAVNEGEYLIPRLDRDQSQAAIEGPVRVAGATVSRRLVQRLLNDLGEDPDQLPIMQHALMRTWERWRRGGGEGAPLDLEHYEAIGRTAEALSRHADEVFGGLPSDRHRDIARRVFKALTEKSDDNRGIRRPLRLRRLTAVVGGGDDEVRTVVDAFRQPGVTFLMPGKETELRPTTVIDISHESLMRIWQRLGRWVEDENQSARIYRRLRETAQLHREGRAGLYHDPDLQIAQTWRDESHPTDAWAEQYGGEFEQTIAFLDGSERAARQAEREAEEARERELEQASTLADTQRRAARGFRRFAVGMAAVALAAAVAFAFALVKKRDADRARTAAQISAETARAAEAGARRRQYVSDMSLVQQALAENNFQRANALLDQHQPGDDEADIRGWAWRYLKGKALGNESARLGPFGEAIFCLDYSPDGRWLGVATFTGKFSLWDTDAKRVVYERDLGQHPGFAFSPTENTLAFSERGSSKVSLLAIGSNGELSEELIEADGRPARFSFSPDGRKLEFFVSGGQVQVWDVSEDRLPVARIGFGGGWNFHGGRIAVGDKRVAVGSNRGVFRVFSLEGGEPGEPVLEWRHPAGVTALAISPDGRFVATGTGVNEKEIRIWDLESGSASPLHVIDDCLAWICWLEFLPDGRHLVGSSADQTVRVWEIDEDTVRRGEVIFGNKDEVYSLAVSADGNGLVTGTKAGWVRFFDLEHLNTLVQHGSYSSPAGLESVFPGMPFSRDGSRMAVVGSDGHIAVVDTHSFEVVRELPLPVVELSEGSWIWYHLEAGVERVIFGHGDGKLTVYDVASEAVVESRTVGFADRHPIGSADGLVASVGGDEIVFWDPRTLDEVKTVPRAEARRTVKAVGPGGLIAWSDGGNQDPRVRVGAVASDRLVIEPRYDLSTGSTRVADELSLSGDGRHLAASDRDGFVTLWDLGAPSPADSRRRFKPHLVVARDLEIFPSGDRLVTTGHAFSLMKLWDRESLQQLLVFKGEGRGLDVGVSPDESVIAVRTMLSEEQFVIELWRAPSFGELSEAQASTEVIPVRRSGSIELSDGFAAALDSGDFGRVQSEWQALAALDPWPVVLVADQLLREYRGAAVAEAERIKAAGGTEGEAIALLRRAVLYDVVRGEPGSGGLASSGLDSLFAWELSGNSLVGKGAVWKFLDDGSDQGTAWREPGFDDGAWMEGAAKLGYSDGAVTEIESGPENDRQITSYFRHRFEVSEGEADGYLGIELLRDDGAAVYLNGNEIVRTNMPQGLLTSETTALVSIGNEAEHKFNVFMVPASNLRTGTNVVAVEVHQADPSSSDLGFDLSLLRAEHSFESYLAQLLVEPQGKALAEEVEALLPRPLRVDWMRDFAFVASGQVDGGDASEISDALWVRRFELRDGPEGKKETAERRLMSLENQDPRDVELIAEWTSRRDAVR